MTLKNASEALNLGVTKGSWVQIPLDPFIVMRMESLDEWSTYLREKEAPIIVEGKRDREALEYIGRENNIFTIAQQPLYKVMEAITAKEIIVLTDLDAEGKKLFAKINRYCQQHSIKVDNKPREFLFKHTTLTQIEGLPHYLRAHDAKQGVKDRVFNAARMECRAEAASDSMQA